ncbi:MAG: transposase [Chloroflexi bacterium]|nr:transposase [Chloroflexota bacterium]
MVVEPASRVCCPTAVGLQPMASNSSVRTGGVEHSLATASDRIRLGYELYAVNGALEHLHVLTGLTPSILVADVAKNLKGATSHFINHESGLTDTLYWQDGYGVITLREAEIPKVAQYIQNQKLHHANGKLNDLFERITPD